MKDSSETRRALEDSIKRWDALPTRYGAELGAVRDEAWTHLCRCADDYAHAIAIINYIADSRDAYVPRFAEVALAAFVTRAEAERHRALNPESGEAK